MMLGFENRPGHQSICGYRCSMLLPVLMPPLPFHDLTLHRRMRDGLEDVQLLCISKRSVVMVLGHTIRNNRIK